MSSEKAGVGGSIPVPGHRHCKELGCFRPLSSGEGSTQDALSREQVSLVCEQSLQELTLRFELRFLVGLRIQLHRRSDIFVTQNTSYDLRITLRTTSDEVSECWKLWKPKRTRSSSFDDAATLAFPRREPTTFPRTRM